MSSEIFLPCLLVEGGLLESGLQLVQWDRCWLAMKVGSCQRAQCTGDAEGFRSTVFALQEGLIPSFWTKAGSTWNIGPSFLGGYNHSSLNPGLAMVSGHRAERLLYPVWLTSPSRAWQRNLLGLSTGHLASRIYRG